MSTQLALCETSGPLIDLLQKLTGQEGSQWNRALKKMLRKENPWGAPKIFEVTTNGRTGEESIAALEERGNRIDHYAKQLLYSKEFVATNNVTYKLALITGDEFEDDKRTNENIRAEATRRGYLVPPVETAPLVREMFSDADIEGMGLWALVVMHKPITASGGRLILLGARRGGDDRWLRGFYGGPGGGWGRGSGFLFLFPASLPADLPAGV